jgi:FkbM family methyltransferase
MDSIILPDDHQVCINLLLEKVDSKLSNSNLTGVVHLGAHMGEEVLAYKRSGYESIVLCEANPHLFEPLQRRFESDSSIKVVHAAIADTDGHVDFYLHETEKGSVESASLLPLKRLGEIVPVFSSKNVVSVPSISLDTLSDDLSLDGMTKLLTIDIQGAERLALQGGRRYLSTVEAIICEVNLIENYDGCVLEPDLDLLFEQLGFIKQFGIYHELYSDDDRFCAWGECLWINSNAIEK